MNGSIHVPVVPMVVDLLRSCMHSSTNSRSDTSDSTHTFLAFTSIVTPRSGISAELGLTGLADVSRRLSFSRRAHRQPSSVSMVARSSTPAETRRWRQMSSPTRASSRLLSHLAPPPASTRLWSSVTVARSECRPLTLASAHQRASQWARLAITSHDA